MNKAWPTRHRSALSIIIHTILPVKTPDPDGNPDYQGRVAPRVGIYNFGGIILLLYTFAQRKTGGC